MEHHVDPRIVQQVDRTLGSGSKKLLTLAGGVGLVATGVSIALGLAMDGKRFQQAWLVSFLFFLSLSLGALFFVTVNHLTKAGWSVVVRRLAELFAGLMPVLAVLALPILIPLVFGSADLYIWNDHDWVDSQHHMHHKHGWFSLGFFLVRVVIYFAIWIWLSRFFLKRSLAQDVDGSREHTGASQRFSAPAMLLYALSVSFAAFDLLMSLDPLWFSTIFGIYYFAGAAQGCFAAMILGGMWLQRQGKLKGLITTEHYHDLGKFLFAFVVFWTYIAFSQFLLIWYADLPEETTFIKARATETWMPISYALLFLYFIVPFFGLLSRHVKRSKPALAFWAVYLLCFHWLDLQHWVMPNIHFQGAEEASVFHILDLTCFLAVGGLWLAGFAWIAKDRSLVPENDPYLGESLSFHNA